MKVIASLLLMFFCQSAFCQIAYVCSADRLTGFHFDNGSWRSSPSNSSIQYSLKLDGNVWKWKMLVADEKTSMTCKSDRPDSFLCSAKKGLDMVEVNTKTLRFVSASSGYYTLGPDLEFLGPTLVMGRCQKI